MTAETAFQMFMSDKIKSVEIPYENSVAFIKMLNRKRVRYFIEPSANQKLIKFAK